MTGYELHLLELLGPDKMATLASIGLLWLMVTSVLGGLITLYVLGSKVWNSFFFQHSTKE